MGVGASRVRDLFEQAKKQSPAIVFIDEIDAVGRQRGTGLGGGHDEREQTLNQLLVEMDGFAANEGVVVLAATNRADVLDPALLRPGRFDRQVYVGLPDIKGREEILKVHAKGKPLAEDVSLRKLAQGTAGFTGADLENLINEGALLAGPEGSALHHHAGSEGCGDQGHRRSGEKKSRVIPQHERELTAYHEAGHAVVMHMLPGQDPVSQITIVPRGMAGGMTISLPEEDRSYLSKHYMEDQIVGLLGGRVAEKLCLNDISTGASNDIQRATAIARKMVTVYGMSERLGTVSFDSGNDEVFIGRTMGHSRGYSEAVAAQIDQEVKDQLISQNVSVVLGSYGSGVSIAAGDTFSAAQVPAIGVTCTNPQITDCDVHYFRICFLDPFQGTVLANYAKNELKATKAYCLAKQGDDYSGGLANYFIKAFEAWRRGACMSSSPTGEL